EESNSEQLHHQELLAAIAERAGAPRQRKDRHQVEENKRRDTQQDAGKESLGVVTKNHQHAHLHLLVPIERFLEHWSFSYRHPHIQAKEHQHGTCQERKEPAEGEELFVGKPAGKQQEHAAGEKKTNRRAELREHAI